ncbi:MAG: hypothetical protein NWE76_09845, partial [Candidatus Bathyarchaeota archaeon]|nr:hypothetical protein [Candidatus Bathyarchaeota archaeon]
MTRPVSTLRNEYRRQLDQLKSSFIETRDVESFLTRHTELVDKLVLDLAAPFLQKPGFAVIATAGYGRREQFPQSDVDLLLVHTFSRQDAEKILSPFLRELWDAHIRLGHQVWTVDELRHLNLDDYEFVLALFNGRPLAGDRQLLSVVLEEILPGFIDKKRDSLIEKVLFSTRTRYEKFGNTIYQLEPDLKEAPGTLRDYLTATWLKRLVGEGGFMPHSSGEVESANRFMQRLRVLLHILTGRIDNRLTHPLQEKLKNHVGFGEAETRSGVESLMKEYFLNARIISDFCTSMLKSAEPGEAVLELSDEDLTQIREVSQVLAILDESLNEGKPLGDGVRDAIQNALPSLSSSISFPGIREQVRCLLEPRPGLYWMLSDMYQLGILELLFPEFETIKARVIRDFYHRYTVDEHTLIAIKSVEDLITNQEGADGRFKSILDDAIYPSHLILGLLFHDVGKGRGGQHADQSARLATRALRRFRFDREEINTISFLIRNHLAMSAVIFRRDLEDPEVIKRFANLVEDPEKLRLLTLLTYADIKAVAPGTLNDWKKDLLWQLYLSTYRKLTLEFGEERIEEEDVEERLLSGLEEGVDEEKFERFLEGFPTRYLRSTPPSEIYSHYRMASKLSPKEPVQSHLFRRKSHYELCIVTPDRSRIFAKIVGLLSYFGMNILRGYGFSNRQDTVLDFFHFSDEERVFRHKSERDRFRDLLKKALTGDISVQDLIRGKEQNILFRRKRPGFRPSVYFEDEMSESYTIMEIIAPDAIGLLYGISREIAGLEVDIELALISTEGEK